ncbi:type II toxin-antitoxin system Phd/YefM family antitoxin [Enterococcus italicus]|uniref:type II toxin-antitoxin system Phd/YefM family antitoxin n=1 Tax=Enterococcus italicus TaxID=246144 RepID=UPI002595A286|nr:type II toxin-antitoxin system Phd/YefM family antitoxin [uncultured Enterococcus sp.]
MELKRLEVPTSSITEVKKSPMDVFQQAREAGTGVYIFNREKIAGVMVTQQQYEELLDELQQLRERSFKTTSEPGEAVSLEGLSQQMIEQIRQTIIVGTSISVKQLDEKMVSLGFITKKTGFGGVNELMKELQTTGKIVYQYRKKNHEKSLFVDLIGELDSQNPLVDRMIVKKILARQLT